MRNKYLLVIGLTVSAIGCQNKEAAYVGTWVGSDVSAPANSAQAPQVAMIKSQVASLKLTVNDKHQFDMKQEAGTWEVKDDRLVLTPTTVNGQPVAEMEKKLEPLMKSSPETKAQLESLFKSQSATLSSDSKTLSLVLGGLTVIFKKSGS